MAYAIRGWRFILLIIPLLFPIAAAAQLSKSVFVMVQAKQDSAATAKYGPDEGKAIAGVLEGFIDDALKQKFPCAKVLDESAVTTMLKWEKNRALLGNPDDEALETIGVQAGAGYLVSASVQVNGDKVLLNGAVLDSINSKGISTLSRADSVSAGGTAAYGPIKQFAENLVNGVSGGPQCTGDWAGTVIVTFKTNGAGSEGGNYGSEEGSGTLTCQVLGVGADAKCTYQSTDVLTGPGGSMKTTKTATSATTWISVGVNGDKLAITIGAIPVLVTVEGPIPIDPSNESVNGGSYIVPAVSDPKNQTGLWADPNGGSRSRITVNWDLTRR